ncbi:hypothetical protein B0A50_02985 [Salinomyces thailandicus]|uniref:F-box domain-containing protein n=1 Tax=Salinomyces thailandicus TaxID=706561 RepID=A0A4U0U1E5_9PEZI|nr:hypothetical protein B0A50_02985 [Salinomyces thailandica]
MAPTLRKRKRASSPPLPPPSRPQAPRIKTRSKARKKVEPRPKRPTTAFDSFATQLKQDPNKLSLLLDLPPELRDVVYAMVLQDTRVQLANNTRIKSLASTSPLSRLNKQIRHEFHGAALLTADIATTVCNFDFRHLDAFLSRASDAELKSFSTMKAPTRRNIKVELIMQTFDASILQNLRRWIKRAGHPSKRGTAIDVQYTYLAGKSTSRSFGAGGPRPWDALKPKTWRGRSEEEARKIMFAMLHAGVCLFPHNRVLGRQGLI